MMSKRNSTFAGESAGMMYANVATKEDDLVAKHAILVKKIAYHQKSKLPSSVQLEDLIQAGMIGLLEAIDNYDKDKGASFETYAGIRIRGSMIDEIRKTDWAPRSVHRNSRKISDAVKVIENKQGRDANGDEVAKQLGVSLEEYHSMIKDSSTTKIFAFEDIGFAEEIMNEEIFNEISLLEGIQRIDFREKLTKVIHTLPEREKMILSLYYEEDMNLKDVGQIMGVSESRISQLHSTAIKKLIKKMAC